MSDQKIKLDKELYKKAKGFAVAAGYSSVDEFVSHLVEREVMKIDDVESEEELKKRLHGLGYIS